MDLTSYLDSLNAKTAGWIDSSYGNDHCESLSFEYSCDTRLRIWIDDGQYTVVFEDDEDGNQIMLSTDNWITVLLFIDAEHID